MVKKEDGVELKKKKESKKRSFTVHE